MKHAYCTGLEGYILHRAAIFAALNRKPPERTINAPKEKVVLLKPPVKTFNEMAEKEIENNPVIIANVWVKIDEFTLQHIKHDAEILKTEITNGFLYQLAINNKIIESFGNASEAIKFYARKYESI